MIYKVKYIGKIPSKKNSYRIMFNPNFYREIYPIIKKYRHPIWISPSQEVKEFESNLSNIILAHFGIKERKNFENKKIKVTARILQTRARDCDNATGAIGDAIEKGIPGFNDRDIKKWDIEIFKGIEDLFELDVEILGE